MRNRNHRASKKNFATSEIMDESMHGPVAELQRLLGYSLNDPRLLVEALTHPSHPSRPTYERLEHLGDAALNLAFTNYLFRKYPALEPGPLTVLRSANVCTEKLARVAVRHSLYGYLRRNTPVQDQMVEEFTQSVIQEDPAITANAAFGGATVKAPKVLADIVESIAGAVYIDTDYDLSILWKVMNPLLQPIVTPVTFDEGDNELNVVRVVVDGEIIAESYSDQRSIAKLNAAREALLNLPRANIVHEAPVPGVLTLKHETHPLLPRANIVHEAPAPEGLTLKDETHPLYPTETREAKVKATARKHWQFPCSCSSSFFIFIIIIIFYFFIET